jgi:hypothetical protein
MFQNMWRTLARVDHNLLVVPEVHSRPLATTTWSLVMVVTRHLKRLRVKEVMMCAVLSRVAPMPPLITKIVRCDERSRLKCNKNLAG